MTRDEAIGRILYALRNSLVIVSKPMREEAFELASQFDVTAADLLERALLRARDMHDGSLSYYEITEADIGHPHFKAFGRICPVTGFIGEITKRDVGKRVYLQGDVLQVENSEQRDVRLKGRGR